MCHNYATEPSTPINIHRLEYELRNHPDRSFVKSLIDGLTFGFHTGVDTTISGKTEFPNLMSAKTYPSFVSDQINNDVLKGYLIGPFKKPPFSQYRVNPIGVAIRKFSGKKRRIDDLSWPHGDQEAVSLNSTIDKETFSLKYVKLDDAIFILNQLGKSSMLCKTDIVDAFKLVPISKHLWHLYGIKWKGMYYFSVRLPFGNRSSPKIFNQLSSAIVWIAKNNYNVKWLLHLLDDFLAISPPYQNPEATMQALLSVFKDLNIPISAQKTEGPTVSLIWLGLNLDSFNMKIFLPLDKKSRILDMLSQFMDKRSCTKREVLSLLGHLNFASRAVPAGRSFVSRLIECSCSKPNLNDIVFLTEESLRDIDMWFHLLQEWNGVSMFLENDAQVAQKLHIETDASGLGYAGIFKSHYFQGKWPAELCISPQTGISIAFQELYPIVVAARLWGSEWTRKRIIFLSDNQAAVYALNKGRSPSPLIMKLIRTLVITATKNSFMYTASYLAGFLNETADSLSRFQETRFRELAPYADTHPTQLPDMSDIMEN